jgi:RNA polymerase sigma factor (sigma-70 family)
VTGQQPFSEVVCLYGPAVLRVCRAMVGAADADDAWSETFLSALRAYPNLPAEANVEAWLVTIAHRKVIDVVRKSQRSATPVPDAPSETTDGNFDGVEFDLAQVLRQLPERQRLAVVYHYLGDLPYSEVAGVIGGTPEAARRAAADGIAKLRKGWAQRGRTHETKETVQ